MARFIVILCLLIPWLAYGQIYKYIDSQGNVTFSDKPAPGSKQVDLPPTQTYQPAPNVDSQQNVAPTNSNNQQSTSKEVVAGYSSLTIVKPQNDEAVRQNAGVLVVVANLDPALKAGDNLQLLMDGAPVGQPQTNTTFVMTNVDRGTHTLQLQVINSNGTALIKSDVITFHMLRVNINSQNNTKPELKNRLSQGIPKIKLSQGISSLSLQPVQTP